MKQSEKNHKVFAGGGWYVLGAAFLWGTTGTAQAFAPEGAHPVTIGTMRLIFGTLSLFFLAIYRGEIADIKHWRTWSLKSTLMAAISIAAYQMFFFAAVARTGVAVGTVVGIGSTPVAAGILGIIFRGERPDRRWVLATALALAGCIILILSSGRLEVDGLGILLAVSAGTAYASYTLFCKDLLDQHPPGAVLTLTFTLGVILLIPVIISGDFSWLVNPRGMLVAIHLGVITVGFAYLLYAIGLKIVPVATAATLTLAEPLTAGFLGIFLLEERLSIAAFIGIALLLFGLLVLALQFNATPTPAPVLMETLPIENDSPG